MQTVSAQPQFASAPDSMAWMDATDEDIVLRVLDGETALFEVLMRRYNQRLYRVARAILRNDSQAEDAVLGAPLGK